MMRSFTVGQIQGIDVKVHPTFALVLVWVIWEWGNRSGGVPTILFGLVLVGLVFACVLLHEVGHAAMAQHFGIKVHDITLVPIGGIARIEQNPSTGSSEILIALAGPAVNVAIAVALAPVLVLIGLVQGADTFGTYLTEPSVAAPGGLILYLFATNIMLVLFNLLPAFPLDGGRVFRAALLSRFDRAPRDIDRCGRGADLGRCIGAGGRLAQGFRPTGDRAVRLRRRMGGKSCRAG